MQQQTDFVGVDVAKAELVIAVPGQRPRCIANQAAAITQWLDELPANCSIAMESTGRYHALLASLGRRAGFKVYVLNARDVHFYAKALGMRGKTDRLDCEVIARYVAEHHAQLHEWAGNDSLAGQLNELLQSRATVATHGSALRQVFRGMPSLADACAQLQSQFDRFLDQVDAQIERLIAADQQLAKGCARLRTITGIGPQTSSLLGALFCRFEFANSDALVAYSGLDPRPNDSGTKRGKRRLSKKGPALLRRQMWLAGFAASHSKALKPMYQALRGRGISTTEAIMIMGRKLLRVAFAVWKSGKPFDVALMGAAKG